MDTEVCGAWNLQSGNVVSAFYDTGFSEEQWGWMLSQFGGFGSIPWDERGVNPTEDEWL